MLRWLEFDFVLLSEPALIAVLPLKNTTPAAQMARLTMFNPGLWIFVLLATLGSILALALWIVIYIRHKRPPTGKRLLILFLSGNCFLCILIHNTLILYKELDIKSLGAGRLPNPSSVGRAQHGPG